MRCNKCGAAGAAVLLVTYHTVTPIVGVVEVKKIGVSIVCPYPSILRWHNFLRL